MKQGNKEYIQDCQKPFGTNSHIVKTLINLMSTEPLFGVQAISDINKCVYAVDTHTDMYINNDVNPVKINDHDKFTMTARSMEELAKKLDKYIVEEIIDWVQHVEPLDLDISNEDTIKVCLRSSYLKLTRSLSRPIQPQDLVVIGPPRVTSFIPPLNRRINNESDTTIVTHGAESNPFMSPVILAIEHIGVSHRDYAIRCAVKILDPDIHFCIMENTKTPIYSKDEETDLKIDPTMVPRKINTPVEFKQLTPNNITDDEKEMILKKWKPLLDADKIPMDDNTRAATAMVLENTQRAFQVPEQNKNKKKN